MKDIEVISDPVIIKIAMEKTRNSILQALKIREMSVEDLSIILGKDTSTIFRHIKKLENAGLVKECKKERRKKGYTSLYTRTAKIFVISTDSFFKDNYLKDLREKKKYLVSGILEEMGFKIKDNDLFDKYFYEINKYSFDKILKYNKDIEFNTLREIYTILSIIYVQQNGINFENLFEMNEKSEKNE
ncbi:MAG: ArsR family transcriptional regulator [Thermoplasmata archaeon]|nr:transcriptional regulator [Thermoplasmata archaeon]